MPRTWNAIQVPVLTAWRSDPGAPENQDFARLFRLKYHHAQWRQIEFGRLLLTVARVVLRHDSAEISLVAAAINPGVAIQHLAPFTRARQADAITWTRDRRQIQDDGELV